MAQRVKAVKRANRWIPISERQPKENGNYLALYRTSDGTADVVEREKIDKAIEAVNRYLFDKEFGSDYRKDVKEIFKRNIGESK